MTTSLTPSDVVRAVTAGVCRLVAGDLDAAQREAQLDALAALYAPETDVRHPFAPLGDRPLRTRAELREHFAAQAPTADRFEATGMHVHETGDPEVVVVEFAYTGRSFAAPNIFVTRVRDGQIVESRDYADHVGMARAFGRLDALAAALAAGAGAQR